MLNLHFYVVNLKHKLPELLLIFFANCQHEPDFRQAEITLLRCWRRGRKNNKLTPDIAGVKPKSRCHNLHIFSNCVLRQCHPNPKPARIRIHKIVDIFEIFRCGSFTKTKHMSMVISKNMWSSSVTIKCFLDPI